MDTLNSDLLFMPMCYCGGCCPKSRGLQQVTLDVKAVALVELRDGLRLRDWCRVTPRSLSRTRRVAQSGGWIPSNEGNYYFHLLPLSRGRQGRPEGYPPSVAAGCMQNDLLFFSLCASSAAASGGRVSITIARDKI